MRYLGLGIAIAAMWIAPAMVGTTIQTQDALIVTLAGFVLAFVGTLRAVHTWPRN